MPAAAIIIVAATNNAMVCKVRLAKKTFSPLARGSGGVEFVIVNSFIPVIVQIGSRLINFSLTASFGSWKSLGHTY
ncbi:hypothetical protein DVQ33_15475 [Yersinia enterocolitica]|nr:hypothetical protein [Yersinia enterocolitica]EKN4923404.1 hypothetical protein [Yersinia enterocolitica]EKN4934926.1 hypothetical protein [Yersinia enterocolitica]EKN5021332.1 hypothetical protein [Yersinia enterocolitica]EKN5051136.1 hypothetical protein [Yersinia enterocolitica]